MLALSNLRKNHNYSLTNDGLTSNFVVLDVLSFDNYLVKNLDTLDIFELRDLVQFGISKDYNLEELSYGS